MIRSRLYRLAVSLVALLLLTVPLAAQQTITDDYPALTVEEDETSVTVESMLSDDVQTRLYTFDVDDDISVTISMTADESVDGDLEPVRLDPVLVLLDAEGTFVAFNDDIAGSGAEDELNFNARLEDIDLSAGRYIVVASSYEYIDNLLDFVEGDEPMPFTLELTITEEPEPESTPEATAEATEDADADDEEDSDSDSEATDEADDADADDADDEDADDEDAESEATDAVDDEDADDEDSDSEATDEADDEDADDDDSDSEATDEADDAEADDEDSDSEATDEADDEDADDGDSDSEVTEEATDEADDEDADDGDSDSEATEEASDEADDEDADDEDADSEATEEASDEADDEDADADDEDADDAEAEATPETTPEPEPLYELDATLLEQGEAVDGEITAEQPVAYYLIDGDEGDAIALTMESEDFDTVLHIFAPTGERLAINDDAGDNTLNSSIPLLQLPDDGTYLVLAAHVFFYNANATQSDVGSLDFIPGTFTIEYDEADAE